MGFAVSHLANPAITGDTAEGHANATPLITKERFGLGCLAPSRWRITGFTPTALRRCAFLSRWGPRFSAMDSERSARFSTATHRLLRRDASRRHGALAKCCALGSSWPADQVQRAGAPREHQRNAPRRPEGGHYVS